MSNGRRRRPANILAMKYHLICISLALICSGSALAQSWRDGRAQVCFVRPENNGSMNTLESWVRIADYDLPLLGGQAACLFVEPGANDLIITSRLPYDPQAKDEQACKSRSLKLELRSNENRTFLICPATKGNSYACGWQVAAHTPQFNPGCNDQR